MTKEVVFLDDNEELIDPRQIMMDAFVNMADELPPPPKQEEHQIVNTPVSYYEQVIPEDLVNLIIKEYDKISKDQFVESEIGSSLASAGTFTKIRDSRVAWWYETNWVSSIFSHYFNHANREIWEYDLNHLDGIQITTYDKKGHHYDWHSDYGTTTDRKYTRKLSASLLLSDPEEYEGGKFQILDYHGKVINPPQKKGTMIIFDSRVPHRVTKLKSGKRISLVSWMLGPKLR